MKKYYIKVSFISYCLIFLFQSTGFAQPSWAWAKIFGGTKDDFSSCVKTDNSGNVFIAGTFDSPTISFGTTTLNLMFKSKTDIFLTKLDANGNILWARSAGALDKDSAYFKNFNHVRCMAIDNSGNCYIGGMFETDSIKFSPSVILEKRGDRGADIFLAKYDANGTLLWAKKFGGNAWDKATGISIDNSGNIILSGSFWSTTIAFDSFILNNTGGVNTFVVKLNSSGTVLWAKCSSGNLGNDATTVALDNSNNIYLGGNFTSSIISFDSQTLNNTGAWDVFLTKYDSNGNAIWARSASGNKTDELCDIKTDGSGNIYLTGRFISTSLGFGGLPPLTNNGGGYFYDAFLAKYDMNGNAVWSKSFGGDKEENGLSLTLDNSGNLLLCGLFESNSVNFDTHIVSKTGTRNTFIAQCDLNGNVQWATASAGNNYDDFNCITTDNTGNKYFFGSFNNSFSIGSYNLSSAGKSDVYLIKFQ